MASTKNTIKDKPPGRGRGQLQAIALSFMVGGLGLALCLTAVPRFRAAAHRLPANGVLDQLANGNPVSKSRLLRAERALEDSLAILQQSQTHNDLARINLQQALQGDLAGAQAAVWLVASVEQQRRALVKSPANSYGWLRLSHLALLRGGVREAQKSGAVAAFLQSRAQSPFFDSLLWRHLDFALLLWPVLQPPQRALQQPLIAAAAGRSTWRLAKMAEQRHAVAGVRQALHLNDVLLADFDRHYLHRIRP
jgi:hypothetical protein